MATMTEIPKVTYTTMSVEQADAFHSAFDQALAEVRAELGKTYPIIVGGRELESEGLEHDISPNDSQVVLGDFQNASRAQVSEAVAAARAAFPEWSGLGYRRRVELLRQAADNFHRNRFKIGALLSLEAGKARLEAIGEVEEAADLITTYCDQIMEHDGFTIKLHQLSPQEVNHSVLRPYGVWGVIAPFNFPVALATGMLAGALVAGNTVVFKPATDTPFTGWYVYQMLAQAGLPPGTINYVTGHGREAGQAIIDSPDVDGIVFTGSKEVGFSILRTALREYPRPCIAEMGGKNPVIVMDSADIEKAVVGTARAAFGYSGQKCSAASRAYIHRDVKDEFLTGLVEYTQSLVVGDPTRAETFMGPVINHAAYDKFQRSSGVGRRDGRLMTGGHALVDGDLVRGLYVQPTIVDGLPKDHPFFYEELFLPFLVTAEVESLDEALALANQSEFGLTAGLFSRDDDEQRRFFEQMQAGVLYVNRAGGATTGAWPGVQSFGGWKGSGSSGKSALGPYYVQQFMREQNQTFVSD
ncbi:MAG TPA: aldehyde dehydrogenase family protein [Chloroflexota bacterium]|nr:aldehyde dehydrogenase family protein [Chloroflexota bacterium]